MNPLPSLPFCQPTLMKQPLKERWSIAGFVDRAYDAWIIRETIIARLNAVKTSEFQLDCSLRSYKRNCLKSIWPGVRDQDPIRTGAIAVSTSSSMKSVLNERECRRKFMRFMRNGVRWKCDLSRARWQKILFHYHFYYFSDQVLVANLIISGNFEQRWDFIWTSPRD